MSELRIQNVTNQARCHWCANEGQVVVLTRPSPNTRSVFEEMGPCPMCEKGYLIEFPATGKPGHWGLDGYWRGRPFEGKPVEEPIAFTPPAVARDRAAEILESLKGATADV